MGLGVPELDEGSRGQISRSKAKALVRRSAPKVNSFTHRPTRTRQSGLSDSTVFETARINSMSASL